jgi:hypothetical protein
MISSTAGNVMKTLTWLVYGLPFLFVGMVQSQVVHSPNCTVDAEIWRLPRCALVTRGGHLYISHQYLKLFFTTSKEQLASRQLPGHGWAYFDRNGLILVQDVAPMDNAASDFHAGLVRVVRNGKWGLADKRGTLITPLYYDGMYEYDPAHRGWKVCKLCHVVTRGEHSWFEGGNWFWLNRQGRVAGRAE